MSAGSICRNQGGTAKFQISSLCGAGSFFVSNEPGSHACMDIWRLPRKSDAPLFAAGYLIVFHIYHQTSKKKKVGESNAGKKCINRPSVRSEERRVGKEAIV